MLVALAKSQSAMGVSHQPVFMGSCLAISHMHLLCLPSGRISPTCLLCPLMIGLMCNDGSVDIFLHGQYGFSSVGRCCYYGDGCGIQGQIMLHGYREVT